MPLSARAGTGTGSGLGSGMNGSGDGHGGEDRPDETGTDMRREYEVRMSALGDCSAVESVAEARQGSWARETALPAQRTRPSASCSVAISLPFWKGNTAVRALLTMPSSRLIHVSHAAMCRRVKPPCLHRLLGHQSLLLQYKLDIGNASRPAL